MPSIGKLEQFDDSTSDWTTYSSRVKLYFLANKVGGNEQVPALLTLVGPKTFNLITDLMSPDDPSQKTLAEISAALTKHLVHKPKVIGQRYRFYKRNQKDHEAIKDFVAAIRALATDCQFGNFLDQALRDKLVIGLKDTETQNKLLNEEDDLTFEAAVKIASGMEMTSRDARELQGATSMVKTVHQVRHRPSSIKDCLFCGRDHARGQCPAWGAECTKCHSRNHWSSQCEALRKRNRRPRSGPRSGPRPRSRPRQQTPQKRNRFNSHSRSRSRNSSRNVHSVHSTQNEVPDLESLSIHATSRSANNSKKTVLKATLKLTQPRKADLHVQVDSAAETNILPVRCFKQLYGHKYVRDDGSVDMSCPDITPRPYTRLSVYGGQGGDLEHFGVVRLICSLEEQKFPVSFFICASDGPILLGLEDSLRLGLITVNRRHVEFASIAVVSTRSPDVPKVDNTSQKIKDTSDLISQYPDCFKGLGKFPGKYKIHLKENATPVVQAPRRCPINLKTEIQTELDHMEQEGIISKIPMAQPTEWLSSLAYARKPNGKLRVCLDPRVLNQSIKRTYHRAPTVEEVTHMLTNAKVFSKLDAKNGYWSIELDEDSKLLTAFNSPASNQRYVYNRLPFGLSVSQDLFQEAMDEVLRHQPGALGIADDVIVHGLNDDDHEANLRSLMSKAREKGLVFNPEKCHINVPEVPFFGTLYSAAGARPDPERVMEITQLPVPQCKQELQSFLGMIQYLAPFIPNLSEQTAPLRSLLKKDAEFVFTATQEQAFQKLKDCISQATTLRYYDPKLRTKIQVDASLRGLGAALIQEDPDEPGVERIIAFASKSLTPTETRYANIERECLAVVFGVEKFHTYIYGSSTVTIESDHKPLEAIHLKNLAQAPPRLQRMLLRLQPYDILIRYRKGSEMLLADFLSRYHPKEGSEIELEHTIHSIHWSTHKLSQLKTETKSDAVLSKLSRTIHEGWPQKCSELPAELRPFWTIKDYLSLDDGIILKGEQIVVPRTLQDDVLSQLHSQCHQGVEKTRLLARKCVFWPNINADIAEKVGSCIACNTYQNSQRPEPMYERELPSAPWQILASDLFDFKGQQYLLLSDFYSKFIIIRRLQGETSKCVVNHLKQIFSEQGIPSKLFTDNGPCYSSREFAAFSDEYCFDHTTSSPLYPQSNGFAERCVQTAKNILKRCDKAKVDPWLAFLLYHATPVSSGMPSPAELLYGRRVRTTLPLTTKDTSEHQEALRHRQQVQKCYYDNRGTKELPELKAGQPVMCQSPKDLTWTPATVVSPTKEPRSYIIQTTDGTRYRRTRRLLRDLQQTPTTFEAEDSQELQPAKEVSTSVSSPKKSVTISPEPQTAPEQPVLRRSSRIHITPSRLIAEM